MIIFIDHKCVIYQHTVLLNAIVNGEYYAANPKIFRQRIARKRHDLKGNYTLYYDNALLHFPLLFSNILVNAIFK